MREQPPLRHTRESRGTSSSTRESLASFTRVDHLTGVVRLVAGVQVLRRLRRPTSRCRAGTTLNQLYCTLVMITKGGALTRVANAAVADFLEAGRTQVQQHEPSSATCAAGLSQQLLTFDADGDIHGLQQHLFMNTTRLISWTQVKLNLRRPSSPSSLHARTRHCR